MKILNHTFNKKRFCIYCDCYWVKIVQDIPVEKYNEIIRASEVETVRDAVDILSTFKCMTEDEYIIKSIIE
jgi:hypothetical protein